MTASSNRRQDDHTTSVDQFLALLDSSREKKSKALMSALYRTVAAGEPATEIMDELGEMGFPDSVVQEAFLAGYQIDIVQNEQVNHHRWSAVLGAIGIAEIRIVQAKATLEKIKATYDSQPRQVQAIITLCGEEYFLPASAAIIDELTPASISHHPRTDLAEHFPRPR